MENTIIAIAVFAFALVFYATSLQETCWYRRYLIPLLFIALALFSTESILNVALLLAASALVYYGYKGYGRKVISEKEAESKSGEAKEAGREAGKEK